MTGETRLIDVQELLRLMTETPLDQQRIIEAADLVEERGEVAWNIIEPLAGIFAGRVRAGVERELQRRRDVGVVRQDADSSKEE